VKLSGYTFGRVAVDGHTHTDDLVVLPDRVVANWWREQGHSLSVADLREVFDAKPDILVVGTGAHGMMAVPPATRQALQAAGIRLVAEHTAAAVETYNRLQATARVAAALHLTC